MTSVLFIFLIAIVAGFLGSLLGLGGGIIMTPALTLLFHVDIRYAIGAPIESAGILLVGIVPNPYMTEKGRDERICRIPHTTMTN